MATFIIHNKKNIEIVEANTESEALDKYVAKLCAKKVFSLTSSFYSANIQNISFDTVVKAGLINACCTTSAYRITAISDVSKHTEINAT